MKTFFSTTCLFFLAIIGICQPRKEFAKQNGTLDTMQTNSSKSKQHKTTSPAPVANIPEQKGQLPKPSSVEQNGKIDRVADDTEIQQQLAKFTKYLVYVGLLQAVVLAFTLLVIMQQAKLMGQHARHLEILGPAIMNSQRAWVIASPVEKAPAIGFIPEGGSNLELHLVGCNQQNIFSCSFKSTGNTPARLVEVALRYLKVSQLKDIPMEPNFGERTSLNDLPLVPQDSIGFVSFLEPDIILKKADADAVAEQKAFLYAFGIAVYRDVYDRLHETRFGYLYHFPQGGDSGEEGFRREGLPPTYNQAT